MPWGVPGWKWRLGKHGFAVEGEPEYAEVEARVEELLAQAKKDVAWRDPRGVLHLPLVIDGEIIGELREDLDPKTLRAGAYWRGPWGMKVQLVKDGRVVGFVWLA